jgi:PKD repeat protein
MSIRRPIITLVIVVVLVVAGCSRGTILRLTVTEPAVWPTTWTGLSTDPDEKGQSNHRDVTDTNGDGYALYYAADSQYLYLRMETVTTPGWNSTQPKHEARYKWWFDTAGMDAYVHGTTVEKAEFLLILEDLTDNSNDPNAPRDQRGELTLMDDLHEGKFMARWDSDHPPNYTKNNAQTAPTGNSTWWRRELGIGTAGIGGPQGVMGADVGYRIDNATTGGNFVDMYVSLAALGNPSSLCIIWATDNIDPNLDQAQDLDRPEITTCLSVCIPPIANFHASVTSPCVNEEIDCFDDSTGTYDSWSWDFGDGDTSTLQNPSHTYTSAGTYTVSLTISNGCGDDTATRDNYITVDPLPEADFEASNTNPCVNESVDFTDDSAGSPTSWSWDVDGDGIEDYNTQNPSHTYTSAGTYTVSLTVSNACGSDDETKTVTVYALPTVEAGPDEGACIDAAAFDLSGESPPGGTWSGTGITDVDNGTFDPATAGVGLHTITYTYTNGHGCTNSDTKTVTVYAKRTATASSNSPICEGSTIQLTGDPDGMSYSWSGPGSWTSSDQNPTRTGATKAMAGTYTLTVTDGGCTSDPVSINVVVNERPTANAGADTEIIVGGSVVIGGSPTTSGGTAPYTYSWTPSTGLNNAGIANPTASPSVTTTYTVTVTDSNGCTDDADVTVTLVHGWCICGFVYRAATMETLASWEVILEKKTSPWHEVQRTITDANGKYCFCGLGNGEYRVSEVVKPGWNQVSPVPNEHLVILPGGASEPEYGPFLNFENEQSDEDPGPPLTVGWEASPIDKLAVLAPWISLFAVVIAGAGLLVVGWRGRGTRKV